MDKPDSNIHKKFGITDCISYAMADVGCNMSFALKNTLAVFWTQYMGLELWYSLLLVLVNIWDAINDPLIGTVIDSDRRKYKRNKFLAYIRFGSIGLIFSGAVCFIPVPNAPIWVKILIFVSGYIIWDAFYTITNVPYGALLSLISKKSEDRASLSAWRSVGSMIGNMLPMTVLPFIIYDKQNDLIGERVFWAALVMGILGFLAFSFMVKNTVIRNDSSSVKIENSEKFNFFEAMKNFLKNRPAVGVTLAAMGMFFSMHGSQMAVTVLFQSYFKNAQISGIVQVFSMIPVFFFTPIARKAVSQYGKKELSVVGTVLSIVSSAAMLILPIKPNTSGIAIYIVCQLINSLGMGIFSTVSWALMGDAIDYNEWKNGKREEGVVFSLHSFFRKLAQGFSPSIVLVVMIILGYVGANKGNQTFEVALNMRYLVPVLFLIGSIIEFIGMFLIYNLDKKKLHQMSIDLGHEVGNSDF